MSPPASAIMSVLSSPAAAGGRDAIDAAVAQDLGAWFQVERLERRGPLSCLYLGRELDGGRPIALKVISRAGAPRQASEAFATAMAGSVALDHPHIIPVYQYGKTRRLFWCSMQHAIARAMSQDPLQRFATVLDFAAVLERAAPAVSSPPPTPSPERLAAPAAKPAVLLWDDAYEPPPVPDGRLVRRVALGAVLMILLAGAAGFGLWLAGRDAAPVRLAVTPPSPRPEVASVAAAPAEPAPPRDTVALLVERPVPRPLPPPAAQRPAVVVAPGRLFVGATPWGEVQIDARAIGHTPLVALPIAAGWHQVRVVRDGFAPFEQRIRVAPGEDVRLTGIVLQPFHY